MRSIKLSITIFLWLCAISTHASSKTEAICASKDSELKAAVIERITLVAANLIKSALILLYKQSNVLINEHQIWVGGFSQGLAEDLDFTIKVTLVSGVNEFVAVVPAPYVPEGYAASTSFVSDNAKYDSLGNVVKDATEVTCGGYINTSPGDLVIYNRATNRKLITTAFPSDSTTASRIQILKTFPVGR